MSLGYRPRIADEVEVDQSTLEVVVVVALEVVSSGRAGLAKKAGLRPQLRTVVVKRVSAISIQGELGLSRRVVLY